MKNVTLALDEATLRDARRIAAARSTSQNAFIRDFLDRLTRAESHTLTARRRISELCRQSKAEVGKRNWNRADLRSILYTEDLNHGQSCGKVRAVNPFIEA